MLELGTNTNTYLSASADEAKTDAFIEQFNANFRDLTGPDFADFTTPDNNHEVEFLGSNSPDKISIAPTPVVFTVVNGALVDLVVPAFTGTSNGAAGVQFDPNALGMKMDSGGLPAPDYGASANEAVSDIAGSSSVRTAVPELGMPGMSKAA